MSDEDRARWLERIQSARPAERTLQHSANLSAANRNTWRRKLQGAKRQCRTCKADFVMDGPHQYYCSVECRRVYQRIRRYGLTLGQYWGLIEAQGNRCAICRGEWRGWNGGKLPHVDHCHDTGRVRGLLCGHCNTSIGRFGDDPVLLRRAVAYLEAASI